MMNNILFMVFVLILIAFPLVERRTSVDWHRS